MAISPLASHRSEEEWTWDILDLDDNFLASLDGVSGGSLKKNVNSTIRTGGSLEWSGITPPNWPEIRVRPTYRARLIDGSVVAWPMGVYLPATPGANWSGEFVELTVDLFDKLLVLDEDAVDETFSLPSGTVVTTAIRSIIEGAGETRHSIADSTKTLVNEMTWESGTSKLRIINDLMVVINYFSLFCDDAGFYRGEPYVPTESRGETFSFKDDEASIYAPDFNHDNDYFGKPNKVILVSQGSELVEGLVSVATNMDEEDPLSYPRRQRWITVTETGVEAADQATLDALALRRLRSLAATSSTIEIEHAIVPIDLNDLVSFRRLPAGLDTKGVIQEMDIPCVSGGLVKTTIREVK